MSARTQDAPSRSGVGVRLQHIDVAARAWLTVTMVEARQWYHKSGVASLNMAMMAIVHPGNIRTQLEGCPDELSQVIKDTAKEAILRVFSRYIQDHSGSTIEDEGTRSVLHTFLNDDLTNDDPTNYNLKIDTYLGPGGGFVQYAKELKHTRLRWHSKTKDNLGEGICLPVSKDHCRIARQGVVNWFNNGYQHKLTWTFPNVIDVADATPDQSVAPHSSYRLPPPPPSGNRALTSADVQAMMTLSSLPVNEEGVVVQTGGISADAADPSDSSHKRKRTREFTEEEIRELVARAQLPGPRSDSARVAGLKEEEGVPSTRTRSAHIHAPVGPPPLPYEYARIQTAVRQGQPSQRLPRDELGKIIEQAVRPYTSAECPEQVHGLHLGPRGKRPRRDPRQQPPVSSSEYSPPGDVCKSTVFAIIDFLSGEDLGEDCLLKRGSSFLDIGAGYGNVVFQAAISVPSVRCVGIEFNESTWRSSSKLLSTFRFRDSALRLQGVTLDNVALHLGEASKFIESSGERFTHIYSFDSVFAKRTLERLARVLANTHFKIFCSTKTKSAWAREGLFLTEVEPPEKVNCVMAVSGRSRRLYFYKKTVLPEKVRTLLGTILDTLRSPGMTIYDTTMGIRVVLSQFSPLSRWLAFDPDGACDYPPPLLQFCHGKVTWLLGKVDQELQYFDSTLQDIAKWAITNFLLTWPDYALEDRVTDLDLAIEFPKQFSPDYTTPFDNLQDILNGHLDGSHIPWLAKLQENLSRWEVRNLKERGLGAIATANIKADSYLMIYGGTIFDVKNFPLGLKTHSLHIKEVSGAYAIDGQHAAGRPKIVQGALLNDGGRKSNAKVEWLAPTTLPSMSHLPKVPVIQLVRAVSKGEEITIPYSPNDDYSFHIYYPPAPGSKHQRGAGWPSGDPT